MKAAFAEIELCGSTASASKNHGSFGHLNSVSVAGHNCKCLADIFVENAGPTNIRTPEQKRSLSCKGWAEN